MPTCFEPRRCNYVGISDIALAGSQGDRIGLGRARPEAAAAARTRRRMDTRSPAGAPGDGPPPKGAALITLVAAGIGPGLGPAGVRVSRRERDAHGAGVGRFQCAARTGACTNEPLAHDAGRHRGLDLRRCRGDCAFRCSHTYGVHGTSVRAGAAAVATCRELINGKRAGRPNHGRRGRPAPGPGEQAPAVGLPPEDALEIRHTGGPVTWRAPCRADADACAGARSFDRSQGRWRREPAGFRATSGSRPASAQVARPRRLRAHRRAK